MLTTSRRLGPGEARGQTEESEAPAAPVEAGRVAITAVEPCLGTDEWELARPPWSFGMSRRAAMADAVAEVLGRVAASHAQAHPGPVTAARRFDRTGLVVAIGGVFDREAVDELDRQLQQLRGLAVTEVVLDLSELGDHHPRLIRVLGRARVRGLIDGVLLTMHDPPPELAHELATGGAVIAAPEPAGCRASRSPRG